MKEKKLGLTESLVNFILLGLWIGMAIYVFIDIQIVSNTAIETAGCNDAAGNAAGTITFLLFMILSLMFLLPSTITNLVTAIGSLIAAKKKGKTILGFVITGIVGKVLALVIFVFIVMLSVDVGQYCTDNRIRSNIIYIAIALATLVSLIFEIFAIVQRSKIRKAEKNAIIDTSSTNEVVEDVEVEIAPTENDGLSSDE